MPTGSIYVNYCEDENLNKTMDNFRHKYKPNFIPKIAEMEGGSREFNILCKKFSDFRVSTKTHQYAPADSLIDFINSQKTHKKQPYYPNYSSVRSFDSSDGFEHVEIQMTQNMQNALLLEGARQSVNPCDLVREVMMFYLAIRTAKAFGEDYELNIVKFNEYLRQ